MTWRRRLGWLLLAGLVVLGIGELVLRVTWHNPYASERADHVVKLRVQHAGTDHRIDREAIDPELPTVRLRSDARGYMLPSRQYENPDVTLAFFGGSTTACSAVQEDLRFPAHVATLLAQRGIRANVLNASRAKNSLHDSINILVNQVVYDRPDIAVVMHATNDLSLLQREDGYRLRSGGPVIAASLARWTIQLGSSRLFLVAFARDAHGTPVYRKDGFEAMQRKNAPRNANSHPEPFRVRLESFVDVARHFGIEPVLLTQPISSSRPASLDDRAQMGNHDIFNQVIREVADRRGVTLVDLVEYLRENVRRWDQPTTVFYDGMHLNDDGSVHYAEAIAERVAPLVGARTAGAENRSSHRP